MRRTDQEFKEEVLRRSRCYRARQAKKRRNTLAVLTCVLVCVVGMYSFWPHAFKSAGTDNAAPESMMQMPGSCVLDEEKAESPAVSPAERTDEGGVQEPGAGECCDVYLWMEGDILLALDSEDAGVIYGYLCSGEWIDGPSDCVIDYKLEVNGTTYRYASCCGTFQDEDFRSLTVPEADRLIINQILEKY